MKKSLIAMGLMLAASALAGCSKEGVTDAAPEMPKQIVELRAAYAPYADATRTTLDHETGAVAWAEGDELAVWVTEAGSTGSWNKSLFTVTDTEAGIFKGEVSLEEGKSYDWYVGTNNYYLNAPDGSNGSFQLGNQTTESFLDNVAAADLLYGVAENVPAGTMPEVTLKHAGTLMKFTVVNGETEDVTPTSIEFSAPEDTYIGGRILPDFKTGEYTFDDTNKWNTSTLNVKNGEAIGSGSSLEYCMVMLPFTLDQGDEFTITITTDKGVCTQKRTMESPLTFEAGTMNTATIKLTIEEEPVSDVHVATLTYDEVAGEDFSYNKSAFYNNESGSWEIRAFKQGYMQINEDKGYIKLPQFGQGIAAVKLTTNSTKEGRALLLNETNSTSGAIATAVATGENTTSFLIDVAAAGSDYRTGYLKSSGGAVQILDITVYVGATLLAEDINVEAAGATDATCTYKTLLFADSDDTQVTCDGTIVTSASIDTDSKTITYSVSANSNPESRKGAITLTSAANDATTTITVIQSGYSASYYEKVTSQLEDWSGKYLILGHNSTNAFTGKLDGSWGGAATVTVTDDRIGATTDMETYVCTIIKTGDKYLIQVADGQYIANVTGKGFAIGATGAEHSIEYSEEGVSLTLANGYSMRCNTGKFRYYTSTTGTSVDLYRLSD